LLAACLCHGEPRRWRLAFGLLRVIFYSVEERGAPKRWPRARASFYVHVMLFRSRNETPNGERQGQSKFWPKLSARTLLELHISSTINIQASRLVSRDTLRRSDVISLTLLWAVTIWCRFDSYITCFEGDPHRAWYIYGVLSPALILTRFGRASFCTHLDYEAFLLLHIPQAQPQTSKVSSTNSWL